MSDVNPLHSRAAAAGTIAELERALATAIRERDEARDNGLEQAAFMTDGLAAKHWQAARTNEADEDVTLAEEAAAMACETASRRIRALRSLPPQPQEPATGMTAPPPTRDPVEAVLVIRCPQQGCESKPGQPCNPPHPNQTHHRKRPDVVHVSRIRASQSPPAGVPRPDTPKPKTAPTPDPETR